MRDFGLYICYRAKWNSCKFDDLVYLISSYSDDPNREDEVNGAFDTCGDRREVLAGFWWGNPKQRLRHML
jgi:hypothetical protein